MILDKKVWLEHLEFLRIVIRDSQEHNEPHIVKCLKELRYKIDKYISEYETQNGDFHDE